MAEPAEESSQAGERQFDWKSKIFDVLTLLVAGLIGVAGGVATTVMTSNAEDSRAEREFLRSQRQEIYAEYLTDVQNAWSTLHAHVPQTEESGPGIQVAPIDDEATMLNITALIDEVHAQKGRVDLIGDAEIIDAAAAVYSSLTAGYSLAHKAYCEAHPDSTLAPCIAWPSPHRGALGLKVRGAPRPYLIDDYRSMENDLFAFIEAGRLELNVD